MKSIIFIDNGYLEKVITRKINYQRFAQNLTIGTDLIRVCCYDCPPPQQAGSIDTKNKFHKALTFLPNFQLKLGILIETHQNVQPISNHPGYPQYTQKMVDVEMALDIVDAARHGVDKIYVVCGDLDLAPALRRARQLMSEVVLVHGNHIHEQLRLAVDKVVVIDKKMEDAAAWMVKESPYVA